MTHLWYHPVPQIHALEVALKENISLLKTKLKATTAQPHTTVLRHKVMVKLSLFIKQHAM
jgi:hypothetical protein